MRHSALHCGLGLILALLVCTPVTVTVAQGSNFYPFDGLWQGAVEPSGVCKMTKGFARIRIYGGRVSGEITASNDVLGLSGKINDAGYIEGGKAGWNGKLKGRFQTEKVDGKARTARGLIQFPGTNCDMSWRVEHAIDALLRERAKQAFHAEAAPPKIELERRIETDEPVVVVQGRVTDQAPIHDFRMNDAPVPLMEDGTFSIRRGVPPGTSEILVVAEDSWGNRRSVTVQVVRRNKQEGPTVARPRRDTEAALGPVLEHGAFHALVIGINGYTAFPSLRSAIVDATALGDLLANRYGFQVTRLIDPTRGEIITALSALRGALRPEDNLLVYYAGHGVVDPVTERGYWLPIDAHQDEPTNWLSNATLTDMVRAIQARHVLVIADSCYSGTLLRTAAPAIQAQHERADWLQHLSENRSRTVLTSGGLESVLDSGGGRHSVFANALLEVLRENKAILDAQALFDPVRRFVVLNANQTPQYSEIYGSGHEGGDFLFVPR
jgi:hypothetical protein